MWKQYSHIIPFISVESGAINGVADWISSGGYKNILVVCDPNTKRVAGDFVIRSLTTAGLTVKVCCFEADEPVPDEFTIGFLTSYYTPDIDLILGVGSGTINDTCSFVGHLVGCPNAIVGTAPSMDGYAAIGSAMLLEGVKMTPPTQCPVAIFCDVDILVEAPLLLTASGLGDMLGKITALADWQLAHIVVDEEIPQDIRSIVVDALDKIIKGAPNLAKRDPDVIKSVTEGLILSGIAMSLYGDSRPASGTEHHLSHFWEMRMFFEGLKPALHGIKVGVGTVVGLIMWKELADSLFELTEREKEIPSESSREHFKNEVRRLYGRTAEPMFLTENPSVPIEHLRAKKQEILDLAKSLPSPEEIAAMIAAVDAPTRPSEIGVSYDILRDSIIYAKERRRMYTIMQLLGNLGCLEDFADRVIRYLKDSAFDGVKCLVLDMDGTIYLGTKVFPYTTRFLEKLNEAGMDHVFYTNNSSQNAGHYISKLQQMGISVTPDKLLTSTQVLLAHLKSLSENDPSACPGRRVFVSGTKDLRDDFEAAGYTLTDDDPDFVVLGFDKDIDYPRLTKLCDFVRSGIPYFGVHTDYNCPIEGGVIPDCGSLAAAVTASTGITPEFFGKPSRYTLDYVIKKTGYREDELCFVGDRLYTDIAVASNTSARAVLVLSGETKRSDLQGSAFVPDLVVENLEELVNYF